MMLPTRNNYYPCSYTVTLKLPFEVELACAKSVNAIVNKPAKLHIKQEW